VGGAFAVGDRIQTAGSGGKMIEEALTEKIIGAAMEVHNYWGPGLIESIYEKSLRHELSLRGIEVKRQVPLHIKYKVWCWTMIFAWT